MRKAPAPLPDTRLAPTTTSPRAIRKSLLQALEESIIPIASASTGPTFVSGEPPLHVPANVTSYPLPIAPLRTTGYGYHHLDRQWPKARLNSMHFPIIACVFAGEADLRVGTTAAAARAMRMTEPPGTKIAGCYVLELSAPSVIVFPPGVPYSNGSLPHWERPYKPSSPLGLFWIRILPSGVHCHLSFRRGTKLVAEHSLLVQDAHLSSLCDVLCDELKVRGPGYQSVSQTLFVSMLMRIQRRIELDLPVIANTALYPATLQGIPLSDLYEGQPADKVPMHAFTIIESVDEHIRLHLQEPLTLSELAQNAGLSPTHLNRLFQTACGTSVMRHVTRRRLGFARAILTSGGDVSIKEVARLCGFTNSSHFSRVFTEIFEVSPRQYRRQSQNMLLK